MRKVFYVESSLSEEEAEAHIKIMMDHYRSNGYIAEEITAVPDEHRLKALDAAVKISSHGDTAKVIVSSAQMFHDFLEGKSND